WRKDIIIEIMAKCAEALAELEVCRVRNQGAVILSLLAGDGQSISCVCGQSSGLKYNVAVAAAVGLGIDGRTAVERVGANQFHCLVEMHIKRGALAMAGNRLNEDARVDREQGIPGRNRRRRFRVGDLRMIMRSVHAEGGYGR